MYLLLVKKMDKKISTFEVSLEEVKENHNGVKNGKFIIIKVPATECCLTCGGLKRLRWMEKDNGKHMMKEACIFCLTKHHTSANRSEH